MTSHEAIWQCWNWLGGCAGDCWALPDREGCTAVGPHCPQASKGPSLPGKPKSHPLLSCPRREGSWDVMLHPTRQPPCLGGEEDGNATLVGNGDVHNEVEGQELLPAAGPPPTRGVLGSQGTWGFWPPALLPFDFHRWEGLKQAGRQQFAAFAPRASFFPWDIFIKLCLLLIPISLNKELCHSTYVRLTQCVNHTKITGM